MLPKTGVFAWHWGFLAGGGEFGETQHRGITVFFVTRKRSIPSAVNWILKRNCNMLAMFGGIFLGIRIDGGIYFELINIPCDIHLCNHFKQIATLNVKELGDCFGHSWAGASGQSTHQHFTQNTVSQCGALTSCSFPGLDAFGSLGHDLCFGQNRKQHSLREEHLVRSTRNLCVQQARNRRFLLLSAVKPTVSFFFEGPGSCLQFCRRFIAWQQEISGSLSQRCLLVLMVTSSGKLTRSNVLNNT